jgi:hypothetical protein
LRLITADAPTIPIAADSPSGAILSTDRDKSLSVLGPVDTGDIPAKPCQTVPDARTGANSRRKFSTPRGGERDS